MFTLAIPKSVKKEIDSLPKDLNKKISSALLDIIEDPYAGKQLQGGLKGVYSWRAWPYRILYEIRKKELIILVLAVGDRKNIYK